MAFKKFFRACCDEDRCDEMSVEAATEGEAKAAAYRSGWSVGGSSLSRSRIFCPAHKPFWDLVGPRFYIHEVCRDAGHQVAKAHLRKEVRLSEDATREEYEQAGPWDLTFEVCDDQWVREIGSVPSLAEAQAMVEAWLDPDEAASLAMDGRSLMDLI